MYEGDKMRRKAGDSSITRKIITLKNFELVDGYVKDMACLRESNDSAIIEGILLDKILPDSETAAFYVKMIYSLGLKHTFMALMQNLAVGMDGKISYDNSIGLVKLIFDILYDPFNMGIDPEYSRVLDSHFISNCGAVLRKIENELEKTPLSFDEKEQLRDDKELLSLATLDVDTFNAYSYLRLIIARWNVLGNYIFTFRLLYDIVALSKPDLWNNPKYRIRAMEVIKEFCEEYGNLAG